MLDAAQAAASIEAQCAFQTKGGVVRWAAQNLTEVTELHACHMLYQAQQIGTGRRQRAADVVFAHASQLAQEIVAPDAQW